jgi:hypothetical protein
MLAKILAGLVLCASIGVALAAPGKFETFTDPAAAGPDFAIQGEYQGTWSGSQQSKEAGAQVIARGEGKFHVVLLEGGLPGAGWDRTMPQHDYDATFKDGKATFGANEVTGTIAGGTLTLADSSGQTTGTLKKVERTSATLGQEPPQGAIVLFDGKSLDHFTGGGTLADGLLVMGPRDDGKRGDCVSTDQFGSFTLHLEFRTPFMPTATGQARGNSGVYLLNRYECQALDSFGLVGADNECGGFYKFRRPDVNMCFPPLAWQTYDIDFTAARFDAEGNKTNSARVTVRHNGVVIHPDCELPNVTPGGIAKEGPTGPLKLQDHGNPVAFRNIWVVPAP